MTPIRWHSYIFTELASVRTALFPSNDVSHEPKTCKQTRKIQQLFRQNKPQLQ
jgi:hypothetical protein